MTLERVSVADTWASDLGCDVCGTRSPNWPEGLFSIDREVGTFTCDMVVCPTCAPTAFTGVTAMVSETIAYWDWFWWTPTRETDHD